MPIAISTGYRKMAHQILHTNLPSGTLFIAAHDITFAALAFGMTKMEIQPY